jgi:phosphatidate cytidylyltransferase
MLKTRVITAIALLAVLFPVLWSKSFAAFVVVAACFLAAATWESFRLFKVGRPLLPTVVVTGLFLFLLASDRQEQATMLYAICVAIWAVRLTPALAFGLPPLETNANVLLSGVYAITLLGCFMAVAGLYTRSPLYLLSVLVVVWVADIGAYFAGKNFGRRRLAPTISPGKTWEGAIGGWFAVAVLSSVAATQAALADTFPAHVLREWGWAGLLGLMTLIVAASVVGDLFESQLKRRADIKDSSGLLPGHGGVLDRVDALIPSLPLAALLASRF